MSTQSDFGQWEFGEDRQTAAEQTAQFDGAVYSRPGGTDSTGETTQPRNTSVCQNCGRAIPQQRRRTMGDNDDVVWACGECATGAELRNGAAAKPGYPLEGDRTADSAAPDYNTTREARAAETNRTQVRRR